MDIELIASKLKASGNRSLIYLIFILMIKFIKSIPYFIFENSRSDVLFLYATKNQKDALLPISNSLKNKLKVANVSLNRSISSEYTVPIFYIHLTSLLFLPLIIIEYFFIRDKERKMRMLHGFQDYALSLGNILVSYIFLRINNPKLIVVSNDHNSNIRSLLLASRKLNIKSVYIQHASVSKLFPPLDQFDLALLDGCYAKDIYTSVGLLAKEVKLVGISKLDNAKKIVSKDETIEYKEKPIIGVALNQLYDLSRLKILLSKIDIENYLIKVRVHPNQMRVFSNLKNELRNFDITWSDPLADGVDDFIISCSYIIAGNSSILLEAAILRRIAIYYSMDSIPYDYYGYIKNGICIEMKVSLPSGFIDFEKYFFDNHNYNQIKYYDDSFGNQKYGRSSEYCSENISLFFDKVQ
ncbi:hypothetical protein [Vibrio splendidus]|uniref:hypothetical protein n=1 Tax=Vibrio splendidus TaxID=29497 RepID=UPI0011B228C0|nr:hypothetical protein [Vibrio splendidus]MCC4882882.1 hypothetical protein [Vibrio splendidus]